MTNCRGCWYLQIGYPPTNIKPFCGYTGDDVDPDEGRECVHREPVE